MYVQKYAAWMLFVVGAVNTLSMAIRHAYDKAPLLLDDPISDLLFLGATSFCLYLWSEWK
ncbi:MAG: hypothetical protein HY225_03365 [Candidatus Vogelbacteria bacterium]|nr:hypothetical protein [Candidatus Vogelbacteria bacterium]